jgi:hypothetical protein
MPRIPAEWNDLVTLKQLPSQIKVWSGSTDVMTLMNTVSGFHVVHFGAGLSATDGRVIWRESTRTAVLSLTRQDEGVPPQIVKTTVSNLR